VAEYRIPELSLVVLVGVSGSGKSTFAAQHFGRFEVISSDFCRGLVADDENDQAATRDAFDVLGYIAGKRLGAGRLTVIDATSVQADARKPLIELARAHDVLPVAIVLDVPEKVCAQRNAERADRSFGGQVIHRQHDQLRRSLRSLSREGFRVVHVLRGVDEVAAASIVRHRLLTDYTDRAGPFDVSATCMAAGPNWRRCWAGSATGSPGTRPGGRPARCRRPAGPRCSSATWWTGGRIHPACSGWSWAWWPAGRRWPCRATTRTS
jgi:predicted kinase